MNGRPTPIVSCVVCREWLTNDFGRKLRKRGKGEEPDCTQCPAGFDWLPQSVSALHLFNLCFDPITLGFRHLPRDGAILEQDTKELGTLEFVRKLILEHKDRVKRDGRGNRTGIQS